MTLRTLWDRLFWWWGCWRYRPRPYVHWSALKQANALAAARRRWVARMMAYAPYRREHHRDLLTGMVVALRTGVRTRNIPGRPGPWRYGASTKGARLVGRPAVYEYRVEPKDPTKRVRISRIGLTEWVEQSA